MALLIGDNFNYQGQKPNFERDSFDTLESMISYPETSIDDGHISYCKETGKHYIFNSSNESTDTGKWREFSAGTYVIDYLPEPSGTVTREQYNELRQAIDNNYNIIFKTGLILYPLMAQNNDSYIMLSFFNDSSIGTGIHNISIEEDLTYATRVVKIPAFYLLQFSSESDTGNITQTQYNDLKVAVNNSYTIAIRRGVGGELQFCTTTFYDSNSEIYLQSANHHHFTYITITPDLTYTIENDTAPWEIAGTEGQVYTYTSNGGLWKDIPNASGPIKDFNDAPEVVKNTFGAAAVGADSIQNYDELAEAVGTTIVTYLYNRCGNTSDNTFENMYTTIAPYNGGILYTIFIPVNPGSYFMNSYGYIFIASTGIIERHTHGLLTRAISDGISIGTIDYISSLSRNITLKTEGTGNQFLADNGQYVEVDASGSSAILPFEKAPQTLQQLIDDYIQDMRKTSYTIDYANDLFAEISSNQTYLYLNDAIGVTYVYVDTISTAGRISIILEVPFYGAFYKLIATVHVEDTGEVTSEYYATALYNDVNGLVNSIQTSSDSEEIVLHTKGDGTQFLSDDGTYKTVSSSNSVIKSFGDAPQVIRNIVSKIFEIINASGENIQFPIAIDYYDELSTTLGDKTQCYVIDNLTDMYSEGYQNMQPFYLYLWNISGQIWINMYVASTQIPNMYMGQYTITVTTNGIQQIYQSGYGLNGMDGEIMLNTAFASQGTNANNKYEQQLSFKINGDGTKYLGDDGEYHEIQQVSSYGTTANRPSSVSIGFQYFDTDLNRPIWWNGTEWVGATDANIVKLTQAQYEALPTKDPDTIYFIKG